MEKNRLSSAYLVLLISVLLLLALQAAYPYIPFFNENFKSGRLITYYFHSEEETPKIKDSLALNPELLQQLDSGETDSLEIELAAQNDTLSIDTGLLAIRINLRGDSVEIPLSVNEFHLQMFYRSLKKEKKQRIGYWGDSMIEGDLITKTLRNRLQKIFGGNGLGYIPITSVTAGFRGNIIHTFSDNWKAYNLLVKHRFSSQLGISGEVFFPQTDSIESPAWVKYRLPKYKKTGTPKALLFYGKNRGEKREVKAVVNSKEYQLKLKDTALVNVLELNDSNIRSLYLSFDVNQDFPIFGISLEGDSGLLLDNFSSRGNSGMPLTRLNPDLLKGFQRKMDYDLIVLQFGINVVNAETLKYGWYEHAMIKVVNRFKANFPDASILIIGLADKGYKFGDEMISDPSVKRVLLTQYRVALKTNVAFFNLYEAMGGKGSMVHWADEEDPPLANKDYTHFNHRGAVRAAGMIHDFLMKHYEEYEKSGKDN